MGKPRRKPPRKPPPKPPRKTPRRRGDDLRKKKKKKKNKSFTSTRLQTTKTRSCWHAVASTIQRSAKSPDACGGTTRPATSRKHSASAAHASRSPRQSEES